MAMTRYNPFNVLHNIHPEFNSFFRHKRNRNRSGRAFAVPATSLITSEWLPAVDIHEETDAFVVTADIPGVNPQDVQIYIDNGVLSIKGERRLERKENTVDFILQEINYGNFERRFLMPDMADVDNIHAQGRNGTLVITISKIRAAQPERIRIETENDSR